MTERYTVGLRDIAVYAAADSSFDKAQKRLLKFCGIKLSANTIKMLCDQESAKMKQWQENNPQSWSEFVTSEGEIEFTIEEKDVFRLRWGHWLNRLGLRDTSVVSALADGAQWIWDAIFLEFSGKARENLDIFHALEYLSNNCTALFGKGTAECMWWYETTKRDLLDGGVAPLLDRVDRMAIICSIFYGEQWNDYWKSVI